MELMEQCTIKKLIRKKPVSPIIIFLPIEEVKKCFQVISAGIGVYFEAQSYAGTLKKKLYTGFL
jgi:hypothetical protein